MYTAITTFWVSAAHQLKLSYDSPCENLHGHNWKITVTLTAKELDENGMVMDFKHIKNKIHNSLDHNVINDVIKVNPTAENMAKWIVDTLGEKCVSAKVQETEGNVAIYER